MNPNLDIEPPEDPEPTQRFALQVCPHCSALTAVELFLALTCCVVCGEEVAVAPLQA